MQKLKREFTPPTGAIRPGKLFVLSGPGGVGKSTLSVNLAAYFNKMTKAKAAFDKLSDGKDREFKQVDAKYYEPVVELIKFIDSLRKQKS